MQIKLVQPPEKYIGTGILFTGCAIIGSL